ISAAPTTYDALARWIALAVIAVATSQVARSRRTAAEPWRAAALLFGADVIVAPWYLPWQVLGLLALAAVVSEACLSRPALVFSGTSMFVGGGLLAQGIVRYGPPLAVAAREHLRASADAPPSPGSIPRSPCPA